MKNYKWVILLFIISCKQDDEVIINNNNVLAGVISKEMIYNDFEPDISLDTLPDTVLFGGNVNLLDVDLNKDGIKDLRLGSHSLESSNLGYYLATELIPYNAQNNLISINAVDTFYGLVGPLNLSYNCTGQVRKLNYREIIGKKTDIWTTIDSTLNGLPVNNSWFGLASKNTQNEDMYQNYGANNWRNATNGYLGLRFIQAGDTLYGWIRLSVVGYSKIILHDCAYEKK